MSTNWLALKVLFFHVSLLLGTFLDQSDVKDQGSNYFFTKFLISKGFVILNFIIFFNNVFCLGIRRILHLRLSHYWPILKVQKKNLCPVLMPNWIDLSPQNILNILSSYFILLLYSIYRVPLVLRYVIPIIIIFIGERALNVKWRKDGPQRASLSQTSLFFVPISPNGEITVLFFLIFNNLA